MLGAAAEEAPACVVGGVADVATFDSRKQMYALTALFQRPGFTLGDSATAAEMVQLLVQLRVDLDDIAPFLLKCHLAKFPTSRTLLQAAHAGKFGVGLIAAGQRLIGGGGNMEPPPKLEPIFQVARLLRPSAGKPTCDVMVLFDRICGCANDTPAARGIMDLFLEESMRENVNGGGSRVRDIFGELDEKRADEIYEALVVGSEQVLVGGLKVYTKEGGLTGATVRAPSVATQHSAKTKERNRSICMNLLGDNGKLLREIVDRASTQMYSIEALAEERRADAEDRAGALGSSGSWGGGTEAAALLRAANEAVEAVAETIAVVAAHEERFDTIQASFDAYHDDSSAVQRVRVLEATTNHLTAECRLLAARQEADSNKQIDALELRSRMLLSRERLVTGQTQSMETIVQQQRNLQRCEAEHAEALKTRDLLRGRDKANQCRRQVEDQAAEEAWGVEAARLLRAKEERERVEAAAEVAEEEPDVKTSEPELPCSSPLAPRRPAAALDAATPASTPAPPTPQATSMSARTAATPFVSSLLQSGTGNGKALVKERRRRSRGGGKALFRDDAKENRVACNEAGGPNSAT